MDICPDTETADSIVVAVGRGPGAPVGVAEVGGSACRSNVKGVVLKPLCKDTDKSIETACGTGVKGPVRACRAEEAFVLLPGKPSIEEETVWASLIVGVEKGDAASTAVDMAKKYASIISGVSCSDPVDCSDTFCEGHNSSRTIEPFPPERDEESGSRSVTYYFPILLSDERTEHSDIDLDKAHVKVHDPASNGAESVLGLTCTIDFES